MQSAGQGLNQGLIIGFGRIIRFWEGIQTAPLQGFQRKAKGFVPPAEPAQIGHAKEKGQNYGQQRGVPKGLPPYIVQKEDKAIKGAEETKGNDNPAPAFQIG